MKRSIRLIAILSVSLAGFSCGGGGGGGGGNDPVTTEPGTTRLSEADDTTATGTYRVTSFDFYYTSGDHFSSSDLDYFSGQMTMDIAADWTTHKLEWRDQELGDFYDYSESSISEADPGAVWDNAYWEIVGEYQIVFYYDNFCGDGYCADVVLRIQKTTDFVRSLLARGVGDVAARSVPYQLEMLKKSLSGISF